MNRPGQILGTNGPGGMHPVDQDMIVTSAVVASNSLSPAFGLNEPDMISGPLFPSLGSIFPFLEAPAPDQSPNWVTSVARSLTNYLALYYFHEEDQSGVVLEKKARASPCVMVRQNPARDRLNQK
jgi:hypothetical protein